MTAAALGLTLAILLGAEPEKAPPDPRDNGPDSIDVSAYPPDQQKKYGVFAGKCIKCHPLGRSVNSHFSATEWKRYMKKMLRRPNSGINEEQAALIYDFLKFHATKMGY